MITVTLRGNFRRFDPSESRIVLLEGGNRVLPTFHRDLVQEGKRTARKARRQSCDGA
jgi:NADH:quinone reductase (non-electrogenic)